MRYSLRLIFAILLSIGLSGPVSAQSNKSVTVDLGELRKGLGDLQSRISATTASLQAVKDAAKTRSDLKAPYATFEQQYKQLDTQIETLRGQATRMRARAEEHYKAWQEQLTKMGNPKLREKAMNRFTDAKEEFDEIIVIAEEAKRELTPFMSDLRDVASYLSTDLSVDAVKSLNNTVWKLGNKSLSVNASLQHVSAQIAKALEVQPESK